MEFLKFRPVFETGFFKDISRCARLFASRSDRTIGPRIVLVTWRILDLRLLKIEVVNCMFCMNSQMRYHHVQLNSIVIAHFSILFYNFYNFSICND